MQTFPSFWNCRISRCFLVLLSVHRTMILHRQPRSSAFCMNHAWFTVLCIHWCQWYCIASGLSCWFVLSRNDLWDILTGSAADAWTSQCFDDCWNGLQVNDFFSSCPLASIWVMWKESRSRILILRFFLRIYFSKPFQPEFSENADILCVNQADDDC